MPDPRTIGYVDDQPSGPSHESEAGIDSDFSKIDHLHQLWTPWAHLNVGFGEWTYSLCPPLIQWSFFYDEVSPVVNPIVTGNPYPPELDMFCNVVNGYMRFRSNGEIRYVDYDFTDPNGSIGAIFVYGYHFTYRYDG